MISTKTITKTAAFGAMAVLLGYVESLFPPIAAGVKLGLSNAVIIIVLYTLSSKQAFLVSLIKVFLCTALFGTATSFVYSLSGALTSVFVMSVAKKTNWFSLIGVSSLGGIFHNLAQMVCACLIIGNPVIFYLPVLFVSGAICGAATGALSQIIVKRRDLFGT